MNLPLKFRLMLYSTVMVIVVVSTISATLLYFHNKHAWEGFDLRTTSMMGALASDLELLVLLESKTEIQRKLESVMKFQDVYAVSVFDKTDKLLAKTGKNPSSLSVEFQKILSSKIEIEPSEMMEDALEPLQSEAKEKIGSVVTIFSTLNMKKKQMEMIYIILSITAIIIVFRIAIDYLFIKGITDPLARLVSGSEAVAGGNLAHRIDVKSENEIGKLVSSFNTMTMSLKERDDEIMLRQQQIEDNNKKLDSSLNEKVVLLREIHHRVKNNLQIITSLLRLQYRQAEDQKFKEMCKDSENRIKSMALVHERLYQSKDFSNVHFKDYATRLTMELLRSFGTNIEKVGLRANIEEVFLGVDTAIPCGLVINELVSNALKHAFPEGSEGKLEVSMRKMEEDEKFELIVRDNGIGFPKEVDFRATVSLGMQLVLSLVENQLRGTIELNSSQGTEFRIRFNEIKYKERMRSS